MGKNSRITHFATMFNLELFRILFRDVSSMIVCKYNRELIIPDIFYKIFQNNSIKLNYLGHDNGCVISIDLFRDRIFRNRIFIFETHDRSVNSSSSLIYTN